MMMIRFLCWHAGGGGGGGGEGARKERRENHLQLKPEDTPDQALRVKNVLLTISAIVHCVIAELYL
jgi:hypothetical protein